jgi:hypothetical protein
MMENQRITWDDYNGLELNLFDQMHMDAGGFWEVFGIVCGVLTVVALVYITGAIGLLII